MKKSITITLLFLVFKFGFSQSWQNLNCPSPGGQLGDIDRNNNTIYATRLTGGFFKSTDGGATWTDVTTNYPAGQTQNFVCLKSGNILLYMFTGSAFNWYKSTDQGATWTAISGSTPTGGGSVHQASNGTIYWIPSYNGVAAIRTSKDEGATCSTKTAILKKMDLKSNGDAYGLRWDGGSGTVKLSKSVDSGQTWTDLTATNLPATCEQLAMSPNGNIYVSNGGAIHKSTDNGNSFTSMDTVATALYTDFNNNLFAGKTSKFQVTANAGTTWQNATTGLLFPSGTVGNIWAHPNGKTYASNYNPSTSRWSIYSYGTGSTSSVSMIEINQDKLHIYPMPANNFLNIELNDKEENISQINVVDLNGKIVLTKDVQGESETKITTANLTEGIYLLNLRTSSNSIYNERLLSLNNDSIKTFIF
ncbi:MAG: T9SS type A sorting domain-containing protein [Bacteroidetes bacterium]|nr:T9SS type A sorting domain-containing protein [Bacteroidota bacterium]